MRMRMASAAAKRLQRRIARFAKSLEPEMARRILRAFNVIRTVLSEAEMVELLALGAGADRVVSTVANFESLNNMLVSTVGPGLNGGAIRAGAAFSIDLPNALAREAAKTGIDLLNPRVLDALKKLDDQVFLKMVIGTQESLQQVIERNLAEGLGHRAVARKAKEVIGLAPNQERAVSNFEKMLRDGNREALTRRLRDRRFDGTLRRALGPKGTGLTESQITKMVSANRRRAIASNAARHSKDAALDATRLGQRLSFEDAFSKGLANRSETWKRRHSVGDSNVRPEHAEIDGDEAQFDEPYLNGEIVAGDSSIGCRCSDEYFTKLLSTGLTGT
jgi:hypothetical protein